MSPTQGRVLATLLAAVLLIGAANLGAYAATGKPLIGGKANTTAKTTTIKSAKGPALALKTKKAPPLKVNSLAKVKKLNADLLDGLDSSALQTTAYVFDVPKTGPDSSFAFSLPGVPQGTYLAAYSIIAGGAPPGGPLGCRFDVGGTGSPGLAYGAAVEGYATVSSTTHLDVGADGIALDCFVFGPDLTINGPANGLSSRVTLTRVDRAVVGSATAQ